MGKGGGRASADAQVSAQTASANLGQRLSVVWLSRGGTGAHQLSGVAAGNWTDGQEAIGWSGCARPFAQNAKEWGTPRFLEVEFAGEGRAARPVNNKVAHQHLTRFRAEEQTFFSFPPLFSRPGPIPRKSS